MGLRGGGCKGCHPLPVGVERRLVFVEDASKVSRNLVVNTFFQDYEGRLVFFILCCETRGRGVDGYVFSHSMRFVTISSIRQNHFNNSI